MKKILTFALLLVPTISFAAAADPFGLNELKDKTEISKGTKTLPDMIAGLIDILLGFLGILTTLIILFGGFKWMTSFGSSDKIDEAKKLIRSGIIGLVLVLTSYAISQFVLKSLVNETIVP